MFKYIEDVAFNLNEEYTTRYRYSSVVKFLAMALKAAAGKGAVNVLRGCGGAEAGNRKTADAMKSGP